MNITIACGRESKLEITIYVGQKLPKLVVAKAVCDKECLKQVRSVYKNVEKLVKDFRRELESPLNRNVRASAELPLHFVRGSSRNLSPVIRCEGGQALSGLSCLDCPKGTFLTDGKCELCPVGKYQDKLRISSAL